MRQLVLLPLLAACARASGELPDPPRRHAAARLPPRLLLAAAGDARDPDSIGYPDSPAWGWSKAPPKASLSSLEPPLPRSQASTARGWILNLVELVHWTPVVPAVLMVSAVLRGAVEWRAHFGGGGDAHARVLLLLLSPLVAFFGGLPGIMMHTYEGWQVAPFRNPLVDPAAVAVPRVNNEWLREVAYKFIFVMQGAGLQALSLAVFGVGRVLVALSVLGVLAAYLGNQHSKTTLYLFKDPGNPASRGYSTMPLAWFTAVPFALATLLNLAAFFKLGAAAFATSGLAPRVVRSLLPPLLIGAGGAIEGLLAETRFNQWLHFGAVVLFNAGFWLQYDLLGRVV